MGRKEKREAKAGDVILPSWEKRAALPGNMCEAERFYYPSDSFTMLDCTVSSSSTELVASWAMK